MILHSPFQIGSRLLPMVKVGGAELSLEHANCDPDGRDRYRWYIDLPDGSEHSAADLRSGCHGGGTQEMFGAFLAFLGACADGYWYEQRTGRESENADLFPPAVAEWAYQHSDEIDMLRLEIEESGAALIEE